MIVAGVAAIEINDIKNYILPIVILSLVGTVVTYVYIRKVAPLGDPVEVTVRGYELSLRKVDAEMIEVE